MLQSIKKNVTVSGTFIEEDYSLFSIMLHAIFSRSKAAMINVSKTERNIRIMKIYMKDVIKIEFN